jgi:hypothetical protein
MIQRIQTVYLLLLIAAFAALFFIPLSSVTVATNGIEQLHVLSVNSHKVFEGDVVKQTFPEMMLMAINAAIILLALVTIFSFKNRKLQMLICKLLMVAVIIFVLLAFRATDAIAAVANAKAIYQAGAYIVIVSLLFIYLALNGIKKDEELVRSADRLR